MAEDPITLEKIRKLNEIRELGVNPYPYNFDKKHSSVEILEKGKDLKKEEKSGKSGKTAGRIVALRRMGKVTFMHIQDEFGKVQLYFAQDDMDKAKYKFLKKLDFGDYIGASGKIFKTKTGEVTIAVKDFDLLSKSTRPLPEKYHGLKDKELRYRQRYVDLIVNPEVKEVFKKRSAIIKAMRDFLHEKGFMEVETPLLQTQYGGANARPFETHINAWDMKMFLSISPELYLKRLIVGGFEKVFTICKNFRNEGVDHSHNPEFTMVEVYQAYSDYNGMMELVEQCYEYCAKKANGTTKVTHIVNDKEVEIDFKAPWPRMTMVEAIKKHLKVDVNKLSEAELKKLLKEHKVDFPANETWGDLVIELFGVIEEELVQPVHIIDMPKEGTPLCKRHREDDRFNEQCEPIGLGMELGNMYSELNDPELQEAELKSQNGKRARRR